MYARCMTTREFQGHIEEIYGIETSPSLISAITGAVMEEVTSWQNRPLEPCYPVVFMDAIRVNIRRDGAVSNKAVFVALAILPDGTRDVLGLWFQANEGANFWATGRLAEAGIDISFGSVGDSDDNALAESIMCCNQVEMSLRPQSRNVPPGR